MPLQATVWKILANMIVILLEIAAILEDVNEMSPNFYARALSKQKGLKLNKSFRRMFLLGFKVKFPKFDFFFFAYMAE